jgi:hypothetical protein
MVRSQSSLRLVMFGALLAGSLGFGVVQAFAQPGDPAHGSYCQSDDPRANSQCNARCTKLDGAAWGYCEVMLQSCVCVHETVID